MTAAATQEQDTGVNVRPAAGRDEARPPIPGDELALVLVDGPHLLYRAQTTTGRAGTGLARARAQRPEVVVWWEALRCTARVPDDLLTGRATPELLAADRLLTEAGLW
ncbi:hypothetical protein [Streptomyces sp. NPDC051704]|uniref:hypothetical protein n=1 Tax=Streptomyces sp. NPDC051704 TaxID=3365671 RepID=UPI0037BC0836